MSNSSIKYFRHAVSLDERRAKFRANLCPPEDKDHEFRHVNVQEDTSKVSRKRQTLQELERQWSDTSRRTDVLEVWFSGTSGISSVLRDQLAYRSSGCHCGT